MEKSTEMRKRPSLNWDTNAQFWCTRKICLLSFLINCKVGRESLWKLGSNWARGKRLHLVCVWLLPVHGSKAAIIAEHWLISFGSVLRSQNVIIGCTCSLSLCSAEHHFMLHPPFSKTSLFAVISHCASSLHSTSQDVWRIEKNHMPDFPLHPPALPFYSQSTCSFYFIVPCTDSWISLYLVHKSFIGVQEHLVWHRQGSYLQRNTMEFILIQLNVSFLSVCVVVARTLRVWRSCWEFVPAACSSTETGCESTGLLGPRSWKSPIRGTTSTSKSGLARWEQTLNSIYRNVLGKAGSVSYLMTWCKPCIHNSSCKMKSYFRNILQMCPRCAAFGWILLLKIGTELYGGPLPF